MKNIFLSRRRLLQGMGSLAAVSMFSGIRVAFAAAPVEQRFIFIILRGAMDGLNAIPPYGDRDYQSARNGLALDASCYTPLDHFFGAHNNLAAFTGMFRSGEAIAVQAVASPYRERSHFDAQDVLESGGLLPHALKDGWLNRALALYGAQGDKLGLAVGQTIPLTLQGDIPVATWAPSAQGLPDDTMMMALDRLYQHDPLFHMALSQAASVHTIADGDLNGMKQAGGNKNMQNKQVFAQTAQAVAKILSDPRGPRLATIEINGWDTHAGQGKDKGPLANNLAALDATFDGLKTALGEHWGKTVVLAATEFGRTVAQNGTGGTDHGTASCAFLAGGALNGGRIIAQWPGLGGNNLYQNRDLAPTTDLRQVAKAILIDHLQLEQAAVEQRVFPNSGEFRPVEGIIKV